MPAVSKAQRVAMAIAEHHPDELYARNKGLAKMTHQQLHDFASTPEKGLTWRSKLSKSKRAMRDRSTRGSPPMHMKEFAQGYRRVK